MRSISLLVGVACLAVRALASAAPAQDYIVTTGPAGIWVLNVNNTSYVKTVPGDPFVPRPVHEVGFSINPEPTAFAVDSAGEYLYATYTGCTGDPQGCGIALAQLVSFRMINGIPYEVSSAIEYNGRQCAHCAPDFISVVPTPHYVFFMNNNPGAWVILIYHTNNGVLKATPFQLPLYPQITIPLTLQVDAREHFAYVGYNDTDLSSNVPDRVAIYDITDLPSKAPRLITTTPQVGGVLLGLQ